MAIANLQETLLCYTMRKAFLVDENTSLSNEKTLLALSQMDTNSMLGAEKSELRNFFKYLYESDAALQESYTDYTEIPDFEDEIDKIEAYYQDLIQELTLQEQAIDQQITTNDVELTEIDAFMESVRSNLTSNIGNDFEFGGN